jgi:hypothetical protein
VELISNQPAGWQVMNFEFRTPKFVQHLPAGRLVSYSMPACRLAGSIFFYSEKA